MASDVGGRTLSQVNLEKGNPSQGLSKKIAVVLFQLGGPDSLEAVEPFLYNLFSDPDIIDFPFAMLARKPLARFIATRRSRKVAEHYKEIGGKSPILELTTLQAAALQQRLQTKLDAKVFIAMRYWHPMTESVVQNVGNGKFHEVVLLPLYPQYSATTSGSSINEWNRQRHTIRLNGIRQKQILHFYDHPKYIQAIVDNVNKAFRQFAGIDWKKIHMLFSAHGVPLSVIHKGDPYQRHIEETVRLVVESGGWSSPHSLCYQSKVGSAEWLKPSLHQSLQELAGSGAKNLLVIPISFVTDHVETLHEINIEAREEAESLGIERFVMMPALNDHPLFIEALEDLVVKKVQEG